MNLNALLPNAVPVFVVVIGLLQYRVWHTGAYILFGVALLNVIVRFVRWRRNKALKAASGGI
jgi:hypothetical protein